MDGVTGWAAVGMAAVANTAVWLKIVYDRRNNNKGDSGNNNNHYPIIMENRTRGLLNKQAIDAVCKAINGMREDHKEDYNKITEKLDNLIEKMK